MPRLSRRTTTYFSIVILMAGGMWAWLSRSPVYGTTQGMIPAPQKGFLAPDFALETAEGETFRLSALRGKAVVLNVWASWCAPCRAEMPALERVYRAYQAQGVEVLGLNSTVQDERGAALRFAAEQGLTFPILFDTNGEATRLYRVRALPTTYFIDAQGIIQEVVTGGPMSEALLRVRVEQLLENSTKETP